MRTVSHQSTFLPALENDYSLYIHIPFCRHRCGYCNFSLLANRDQLIDRYIRALEVEISWLMNKPRVTSIFLGGGTPSRLAPGQLERLINVMHNAFTVATDAEITCECNPSDITMKFCDCLRDVGVNRISLGIQSFQMAKLQFLQRDHDPQQIKTAFEILKSNFENVSFDLIFATESESLDVWQMDLELAMQLQPAHLSTYELTIEKGTTFWNRKNRGSLQVPNEDVRAELYEATIEYLMANGYQHYEISSFARCGFRCQHNSSYWDGSDYLAFGTSAARYVNSIRETNHRSATTYMKRVEAGQSPVVESEFISPQNRMLETVAFGLRQIDGISISQVDGEEDVLVDTHARLQSLLQGLTAQGLLQFDVDGRWRLTRRGVMLYDQIAMEIIAIS